MSSKQKVGSMIAISKERVVTLVSDLNESHQHFVAALIDGNSELMMIAYANYIIALGIILQATRE